MAWAGRHPQEATFFFELIFAVFFFAVFFLVVFCVEVFYSRGRNSKPWRPLSLR